MPPKSSPSLDEKFRVKIASSGLSLAQAKTLKFETLTFQAMLALGHKNVEGFKLPYFDPSGKPTKFYRVRYLATTKKGFARQTLEKDQRYDQPAKVLPEVYFPPLIKWLPLLADSSKPIYITEGELKAACATARGFPTLGLGGVWNFGARHQGLPILPIFEKLNLAGRTVFIAYDADAATNPNVVAAENALCKELTSLKAIPYILRLPALPNIPKTGLDDFLLSPNGVERFRDLEPQEYERAKALHAMNGRVVYVRKPSIILDHASFDKMSVTTFKNERFANESYLDEAADGKVRVMRTAQEWIGWKGRAEVANFTYEPGKPRLVDGALLNLWKGFPVEPKKGDVSPWLRLMEYVFQDEPESRKWFERWLVYPLQNLGVKMLTAVVMLSIQQGTGKTLIGHTMQRIYGENSALIGNDDLAAGNNAYAENRQFIVGEEITGSDKRELADALKSLVTNEELRINIKYVPEYRIRNCVNYYFTTNNPDAFIIDDKDRRIFAHEIKGEPLPTEFYTRVYDPWYKSKDGIAALFDYFLELDLGDFDPKARAPMTLAKSNMIDNSKGPLGHWVAQVRDNAEFTLKAPYKLWSAQELFALYDGGAHRKGSVTLMGVELGRAGFIRAAGGQGCRTKKSGQVKLWIIRDVENLARMPSRQIGELYDEERNTEPTQPKFSKGGKK